MRLALIAAVAFAGAVDAQVVLDRMALIVNDKVIKASEIDRDLRVTSFINETPLEFTPAARKKAADRLIEQALIRREVNVANYPPATDQELNELLAQLKKQRGARFASELKRYGITEEQLRKQLAWQITVLHFIEQRFRPGVQITDADVQDFLKKHVKMTREQAEQQIAGERVNTEFFNWLDRARKRATVEYREAALK